MDPRAQVTTSRRIGELRAEFPSLAAGRSFVVSAFATAATPEQDLTVSEWADLHRKVSAESGSPFPGDWRTSRVPYLRQPMDCLHPDHPARRVGLKFSAQTGKSEVGVNWFGFIVDRAPGPTLTVLPTGDEASKYNRVKLQPTIDASPKIRHRVKPENSRDEGASTTAFKRFGGGFNQITTASSSKGLQMISIRWLILDELSGFPADADGRGSPAAQARARQKAFGDLAKELAMSTPGVVGSCEISQLWLDGDRRRFYVPCPHCGVFQVLKFERMQAPSEATHHRATFACAASGCIIDQTSMEEMRQRGEWVPTVPFEDGSAVPELIGAEEIARYATPPCEGRVRHLQPSYALWAAYSPFESWTELWRRGRDAKGDPAKEKPFWQQDLGEAYEELGTDIDPDRIAKNVEDYPAGIVPEKVGRLVLSVDTQDDRFEWAVYGFGPAWSGNAIDQWLIATGVLSGDLHGERVWQELDDLARQTWPHAGGKEFPVDLACIDTGGHHTQSVYKFIHHKSRWRGLKGSTKRDAVVLSSPSHVRVIDDFKRVLFKVPLYHVGGHDLKLWVMDSLKAIQEAQPKAGALRLTKDIVDERYASQLAGEALVQVKEAGRLVSKWVPKPGVRNEALDLAVYARAVALGPHPNGLGVGRFSLKRWSDILSERHAKSAQADLFSPEAEQLAPAATATPEQALAPPPAIDLLRPEPVSSTRKRFSSMAERFNRQ